MRCNATGVRGIKIRTVFSPLCAMLSAKCVERTIGVSLCHLMLVSVWKYSTGVVRAARRELIVAIVTAYYLRCVSQCL